MNKRILTIGLMTLALAILISMTSSEMVDHLSVGKQLNFNGAKYDLKWSAHP